MVNTFTEQLGSHISFQYISFDRVVLRGYIPGTYMEGSIINLLRNLGYNNHTNGVLRLFTDQLNSHLQKKSQEFGIDIIWWGSKEKKTYNSKIDFIQKHYKKLLLKPDKKSKIIAVIKATENAQTFSNKMVSKKNGGKYLKMYKLNKYVSYYYIYIKDEVLGLCYLKIASYMPFVSEFYFNGHNYLSKQLELKGVKYRMKDNSFVSVDNVELLQELSNNFKPSIALNRIDYWMSLFFKFDKGEKSTRSKLLKHNWFTYQTEISTNIIFKSAKFANQYFHRVLSKHHTIGLPDRLTEIFSLKKAQGEFKTTQNKFKIDAVIRHWYEKNSIKCYNKSGCLLRVETTINRPGLPGLKLKKPAINLMAYYWYGLSSNNRYLQTISDIDISNFEGNTFEKYQKTVENKRGAKIPAPDLRKEHQIELLMTLILTKNRVFGFSNKDLQKILKKDWKTAKIAYELRKLRERGAVKRLKHSHYYQLTEEGYNWIFLSFYNHQHFVKPLMSVSYKTLFSKGASNRDKIEKAYSDIKQSVSIIMNQFALAS